MKASIFDVSQVDESIKMDRHNITLQNHGNCIKPMINSAVLNNLILVNFFGIIAPFCILGVFSNIANIIVYYKLGFNESTNINFLVLSVFDFFISLISLLSRGLWSPAVRGLSVGPVLKYAAHCLSHALIVVQSGSAMMTALISAERCVCVVFPLKVKTLLSRRRSFFMMVAVVAYHVAFTITLYTDTGPPYDAYPKKLAFYYFALFSVPSTACFFAVVLTTFFLVLRVRSNQRWRNEQTSQANTKTSAKADKLVRTIISISTLFIVCSLLTVAIFFGQIIHPPLRYGNPYLGNFLELLFSFSGIFQAISASVNIFFYYTMSSKFQKAFVACFYFPKDAKSDVIVD